MVCFHKEGQGGGREEEVSSSPKSRNPRKGVKVVRIGRQSISEWTSSRTYNKHRFERHGDLFAITSTYKIELYFEKYSNRFPERVLKARSTGRLEEEATGLQMSMLARRRRRLPHLWQRFGCKNKVQRFLRGKRLHRCIYFPGTRELRLR